MTCLGAGTQSRTQIAGADTGLLASPTLGITPHGAMAQMHPHGVVTMTDAVYPVHPQVQILGLLAVLTLPDSDMTPEVAAGAPDLLAATVKLLSAYREQQASALPCFGHKEACSVASLLAQEAP